MQGALFQESFKSEYQVQADFLEEVEFPWEAGKRKCSKWPVLEPISGDPMP